MKNKNFLIYLADLTHDYHNMRQFIPLGIGFLASYAYSDLGDQVEIKLFKSVNKLLDALDEQRPDLLGLSNYTWNKELSSFACKKAKEVYPDIPIIMGGPNIGTESSDVEQFLRDNEFVDVYCMFSSERSFVKVIRALLDYPEGERTDKNLRTHSFDGCYSLCEGALIGNSNYSSEKELDYVPSPYTMHLLDEFIDEGMVPLFETNRGCPYSCSFCAWGITALNKLRVFGLDRVMEDLDYVARYGVDYPELHFVDANFGILKRDVEIARHLRELHGETEAFAAVTVYWSKAAQPHMLDVGRYLGHLTTTYVAFQSLDEDVLSAMKRKNINSTKLLHLIQSLKEFTQAPQTDILVGSPAETVDSHLLSLDTALEFGIQKINGGEIRMLPGTEMETAASREEFGIKTKYRLFEGGNGIYRGELVYEMEEVIRQTNAMSEEEMIRLRSLRAFFFGSITLCEHWPLIAFLTHNNVRFTPVLLKLLDRKEHNPDLAKALDWLESKADEEFFESPEEISEFLSRDENRQALIEDRGFIKLNFGFTGRLILQPEEYAAYYDELEKILVEETKHFSTPQVISELLKLCQERNYLTRCLNGKFEREITVPLSRPTIEALLDCEYLAPHQVDGDSEHLQLSMEPVTSHQIKEALDGFKDRLSPFTMSQVMQMFWGRCHLEPRDKLKKTEEIIAIQSGSLPEMVAAQ